MKEHIFVAWKTDSVGKKPKQDFQFTVCHTHVANIISITFEFCEVVSLNKYIFC